MYRMPVSTNVTNPDSRTIGTSVNQTTAIRIDDSSIGVRKTWSSDKINRSKADSEQAIIEAYTQAYGVLYLSMFEPEHIDDWADVIYDAYVAYEEGKPFLIPWTRHMTAQVIKADPDADEKLLVFYRGQTWAVTDHGMYVVDMTSGDAIVTIHTTADWDAQRQYVPKRGEICIYSDRNVVDGVPYPGIKIGDGNAYVIDLPFFGDDKMEDVVEKLDTHIADDEAHVSTDDRVRWDSKLNYIQVGECLSFNRN